MAHKVLVNGTAYGVKGGKTLVNGTGYAVKGGRTLWVGTGYDIAFSSPLPKTVRISVYIENYNYMAGGTITIFVNGVNKAYTWVDEGTYENWCDVDVTPNKDFVEIDFDGNVFQYDIIPSEFRMTSEEPGRWGGYATGDCSFEFYIT